MLSWLAGEANKKAPSGRRGLTILCMDYPLISRTRFASPLVIKTIRVLAINALMAVFAGMPDGYVKVLIIFCCAHYGSVRPQSYTKN